MTTVPTKPLEIFYSYSPKDEALREKLESQLGSLKRLGLITDWHHRELLPGTERRIRVDKHLATASIILLLISPDFIASDYCYSNEMARALEQHNTGKARVIPIILRPTDYEGTPFETLQALPLHGKAVTECRNRDSAFRDIVKGIRQVIEDIHAAGEQDSALDMSSQEYCHTIFERGKTLDFKGILHVNQNQPISIPLLDVFVPPKVVVGVPEYETMPNFQTDEDVFPQELREEYESVSRAQKSNAPILQGAEERSERKETRSFSSQGQNSPREKHLTFHLEDLQEVLSKHRRLVLLGDPGSGKSTLLRYLLLLLSRDHNKFFEVFPSIVEEDLAIPLYLPLASYADAWRHYPPGERSLKTFLERYLCENYLDAYSDTIIRQLSRGKALLLFDGLDEIPDASLRLQIVQQVEILTQAYPTNRFIITSRIVGYTDAPVSFSAGYQAYVLAPFDEQQIKSFLQCWCPAYEHWVKGTTDQQYLQYLATKEADSVFQSVHSRPAVRRLAGNPLLLTILALLQRQGINLPAHRVELYELCTMTLLDTWGRTRGSGTTTTRFTRHELIKVLRPLAFWMHEHSTVSAIPEEELVEQIVKQLLTRKIARSEDEAIKLAEEFLQKVRGETGILIERGKKRYGFLHLTFEEYFAAGELEQREDRKDFIKAHLHDSRWREVILLTIGIPGILYHKERDATEMVRQTILAAESPFEHWLHRDLLLAGICLADDVGIDMECEDEIIERILSLILTSPYDALVEKISDILTSWQSTRMAEKALGIILPVLQQHNTSLDPLTRIALLSSRTYSHLVAHTVAHHYQALLQLFQESVIRLLRLQIMILFGNHQIDKQEWVEYALTSLHDPNGGVREKAAELLGQLDDDRPEILQRLLDLLSDTNSNVRQAAAKALGERESREETVITGLLSLLSESDWRSKQIAVETLGQLGCKEPRIREKLLRLFKDTIIDVRQAAIKTLWQLDHDQPEVIEQTLRLLSDANVKVKQTVIEILGLWEDISLKTIERFFDLLIDDDPNMRQVVAQALGHIGSRQPEIVARLLDLLSTSDVKIREGAIRALGLAGQRQQHIFTRLFELLSSSDWQVRSATAEALGYLGCDQPGTVEKLLNLLSDPFPSVRQAATGALGQIGSGQPAVIEKLLDLLYDHFPQVKQTAIQVLGQWKDERQEIIEELLESLSDFNCLTVLEVIKALAGEKEKYPQVTTRLVELLSYPLASIRQASALVAGQLSSIAPEVVGKLLDLFYDDDDDVCQAAAKALKQQGNRDAEVLRLLAIALEETSPPSVTSNAHFLEGLDEWRKGLNRRITLRLLYVVKSLGKGHSFLAETLYDLLSDSNGAIREEATKALGELKVDNHVIREELGTVLTDHNWRVRRAAINSLGKLGVNSSEVVNKLLPYLFDNDPDVQQATLDVLRQSKGDLSDKIPLILSSLISIYPSNSKSSRRYQHTATQLLKELSLSYPDIIPWFLQILSAFSADYQLKRVAAKALGYVGEGQPEVIKELFTMFLASHRLSSDQEVLVTALGLLGKGQSDIVETLLNIVPNSSTSTPLRASETIVQALGLLGSGQSMVVAKLLDLLPNLSTTIQPTAVEALERVGNRDPETIARLLDLLSLPNLSVRANVIEALGQLGDGQEEITEKLLELVSSANSSERNAALIALAKQSREPMQVMDILLKSLTNSIPKNTWMAAISYILASPQVDRLALSQQVEQLLYKYELLTKSNLTATYQVELLFLTLQQSVGDMM